MDWEPEFQESEPNRDLAATPPRVIGVDKDTGEIVQYGGDFAPSAESILDYVSFGEVGLQWHRRMDMAAADKIMSVVWKFFTASAWYIGDFLLMAEQEFGEEYAQLIPEMVGLSPSTLANYKWVCSRFPVAKRRKELTYSHHEAVAKLELDEACKWLEYVVKESEAEPPNKISVAKLKKMLKGVTGKETPPHEIECPSCGAMFDPKTARQ